MSGPVTADDAPASPDGAAGAEGPVVELEPGRMTQVGSLPVRRVLPHRPRRTVGAWCFATTSAPCPCGVPGRVRASARIRTWVCRR